MIKYIFKNQRKKKCTFSRRTAPKRRNRSITKSCGDAKIELFPGARPPDTTFTSWYDLTLALVQEGFWTCFATGCDGWTSAPSARRLSRLRYLACNFVNYSVCLNFRKSSAIRKKMTRPEGQKVHLGNYVLGTPRKKMCIFMHLQYKCKFVSIYDKQNPATIGA